jgi:hypothetical protein
VEQEITRDNPVFRDFFFKVEPIRFREPLAQTLGAFTEDDAVLNYTFIDTVKMAGHACPTVAGAYLVCQAALKELYGSEAPMRGSIAVTVYGEPDEGGFGVMAQVFSFLTGAASETGFKGLGPKFGRKDLLTFSDETPDPNALCFKFIRLDVTRAVLVKYIPGLVPFPAEKSQRMGRLMGKVLSGGADADEKVEFRNLWMEKVEDMLIHRKGIEDWLKIEKTTL